MSEAQIAAWAAWGITMGVLAFVLVRYGRRRRPSRPRRRRSSDHDARR